MPLYQIAGKRLWLTGHRGLVGTAVSRALQGRGDVEILTVDRDQLDLRDQDRVVRWVADRKPQVVLAVAAKVGGIQANRTFPAEFLYDNLMIEGNVVEAARRAGVEKLLFVASSAVYPQAVEQPIREQSLLTGPLEPTHEAYALAKTVGVKLCQMYRRQYGADFLSAIPANLYGPNDNFDPTTSTVLPALLYRMHLAARQRLGSVSVWGSGRARREFIHVDDVAQALLFLLENYAEEEPINIGSGFDVEIRELAEIIRAVTGFSGRIEFDRSKPDGTMRKLLDSSRITALGWHPAIPLPEGIELTYRWLCENGPTLRGVGKGLHPNLRVSGIRE